MTLTEFLLARLAGDEARVLADVAAKRAILGGGNVASDLEHFPCDTPFCDGCNEALEVQRMVKLLAQPYSDHPDFDLAWVVDE